MRCFMGTQMFLMRVVQSVCLISLLTCALSSRAQTIEVRGGFLADSIKIGETTAYYLSAHYGDSLNILFPDSTFQFSTFEFDRKAYFATETRDNVSVDSAVYYLSTFEVDRTQTLKLPVFILQPADCTVVESAADTILIEQMVAAVPDSLAADQLPLKMNTAYQKVFHQFNYWILLIVVGVLLIIAFIVWIFFGKRISRYLQAKRLQRKHNEFVKNYGLLIQGLQTGFSSNNAEKALSFWKRYMEVLERYPFTKLTTRETLTLTKDEALANNLKQIDRAIYADQPTVLTPFEQLRAFADERFNKKLKEVQHG
ncbi:MAG TPA: hypothetical protein VGD40_26085 [Chryseosolibacter sp.]